MPRITKLINHITNIIICGIVYIIFFLFVNINNAPKRAPPPSSEHGVFTCYHHRREWGDSNSPYETGITRSQTSCLSCIGSYFEPLLVFTVHSHYFNCNSLMFFLMFFGNIAFICFLIPY